MYSERDDVMARSRARSAATLESLANIPSFPLLEMMRQNLAYDAMMHSG